MAGPKINNSEANPSQRKIVFFYPMLAFAIGGTAFWGFFYTYFAPIIGGVYQAVSPTVHLHGWSFFLWYLLFPAQTLLIASGRTKWHMTIGKISPILAFVMLFTGLIVIAIRLRGALAGDTDGFSIVLLRNGPLILSSLLLFSLFYTAGVVAALTNRFESHRRLIILASSAGLGAAVFRVFGVLIGFGEWTVVYAMLATNSFVIIGMMYDKFSRGSVHITYWVGLAIALSVELAVSPFHGNPIVGPINSALAALASYVEVLY